MFVFVYNIIFDIGGMRQWCSGNINAFQAFALDSISGWRTLIMLLYI